MSLMKAARAEHKITLSQLALKTGVSESHLSLIESGARRPSVDVAKRLASVLGFEWTKFFETEPTD